MSTSPWSSATAARSRCFCPTARERPIPARAFKDDEHDESHRAATGLRRVCAQHRSRQAWRLSGYPAMSAILPLRDYQREAIAELHRRWDAGDTRVPMVLATGLGKTVIFAHLIADWVRANVAKRVIVLVHTDELVQQAYKKIRDTAPALKVGIVKAERNEVTARVIVASVQSLRSAKRRAQIRNVGLIIVDECHHATATTYRNILDHYGALPTQFEKDLQELSRQKPRIQVAGFTATLARGDKAKLSDIWQECTFQRGIAFGIRRGYLLDVRGKRIVVPDLDLSTVKKSGGDYQDASLGNAMDAALAPSVIA